MEKGFRAMTSEKHPRERLDELESAVRTLQVDIVKLTMDIHMLKLLNKILSEVNK